METCLIKTLDTIIRQGAVLPPGVHVWVTPAEASALIASGLAVWVDGERELQQVQEEEEDPRRDSQPTWDAFRAASSSHQDAREAYEALTGEEAPYGWRRLEDAYRAWRGESV